MDIQNIIVYFILACTAAVIIFHIYRQITGKGKKCNCGECPMHEGECHCHDTQK